MVSMCHLFDGAYLWKQEHVNGKQQRREKKKLLLIHCNTICWKLWNKMLSGKKKYHQLCPSDDGSLCLSSSSIFMSFRALDRSVTSRSQQKHLYCYHGGLCCTKKCSSTCVCASLLLFCSKEDSRCTVRLEFWVTGVKEVEQLFHHASNVISIYQGKTQFHCTPNGAE